MDSINNRKGANKTNVLSKWANTPFVRGIKMYKTNWEGKFVRGERENKYVI